MRQRWISALTLITLLTAAIATIVVHGLNSQGHSTWHGLGEGTITVTTAVPPKPVISYVYFSTRSIKPGDWITVTVKARNDGGTAKWMTIHIGLPFNPPTSDVVIVSTDLDSAKVYPPGSEMWAGYGSYKIKTKYVIVEGYTENWKKGVEKTLTIKVKFPDTDTVAFDLKTAAEGAGQFKYYPTSGMIDQQDEYVLPYLILRKFTVTVTQGGTAEPSPIRIINHRRYPYKKTQPSMRVEEFVVEDYGGFKGKITATNIPFTIAPGETGELKLKVSAASDCPTGTYTIRYYVRGSP